jgi:hypothetical protein
VPSGVRPRVALVLIVAGATAAALTDGPLAAPIGRYGWPLLVTAPGLMVLAAAFVARAGSCLTIPGTIITVLGLLLTAQNALGLWGTWTYAWALPVPTALGLGIWLQGRLRGSDRQRAVGIRLTKAGLLLCCVLAAFFEGVVHVSQSRLGGLDDLLLPAALVLMGLWLLVRRLLPDREGGRP